MQTVVLREKVWFKVSLYIKPKLQHFACICYGWLMNQPLVIEPSREQVRPQLTRNADCRRVNAEKKTHQLQTKGKVKASFTARDHKRIDLGKRLLAETGWGFGRLSTLRSVWRAIRPCSSSSCSLRPLRSKSHLKQRDGTLSFCSNLG